jgi:DegV family protein with EDD domain
LSGTVESARRAAEELGDGRVRAIDTGTISAGLALLALAVQRLLERGTTDEEADALVERFQREGRVIWTVETFEFLAKGGRIGKAAAMAGTLLKIKPILGIENGEVVPRKRVRGAHKAFLEFAETFEGESRDRPSLRVGIAHADAPDRLAALRELVGRTRPQAQIEVETMLGAVVGTHSGPGAVGLFWFDDAD